MPRVICAWASPVSARARRSVVVAAEAGEANSSRPDNAAAITAALRTKRTTKGWADAAGRIMRHSSPSGFILPERRKHSPNRHGKDSSYREDPAHAAADVGW